MIKRTCDLDQHCSPPHAWERLNPQTMEPYTHGRVVFLCATHRNSPETESTQ